MSKEVRQIPSPGPVVPPRLAWALLPARAPGALPPLRPAGSLPSPPLPALQSDTPTLRSPRGSLIGSGSTGLSALSSLWIYLRLGFPVSEGPIWVSVLGFRTVPAYSWTLGHRLAPSVPPFSP